MKIAVLFIFFLTNFAIADSSVLCDDQPNDLLNFSQDITARATDTLSVVTWNAHKYANSKYFSDLVEISADTDVIMIQEAMHSSQWQETFAKQIPFSFTFFESFCDSNNWATGVQTGARYKLEHEVNLVSPDREPITGTPKVTGISRFDVPGYGGVLIANIHGMNFNTGNKFERQIDQVVEYLAAAHERIIWAGDFNTWSASRRRYLDKKAKSIGLMQVIPVKDNRSQKLDHIYVRGFKIISGEILPNRTSDHQPIKAVLKFEN